MRGVSGNEGTVDDMGYKVLRVFGWQGKGVVELAKARTSEEEDRGIWIGVRGRNQR